MSSITDAAHVTPTPLQRAWQEMELIAFVHFTVNAFTDKEWGDGTEDPVLFNPTDCNPHQWVQTLKNAGFKMLILTAKHHDGFCLWPSRHTDHSVAASPYKDGQGDVVRETAQACADHGLDFGIYLSPWDRHDPRYGTDEYNDFYCNQLQELLTDYGPIRELWLDGAKPSDAQSMRYDWARIYKRARELQPEIVIKMGGDRDPQPVFTDEDVQPPDIRWIGNEDGLGRDTEWCVYPVDGPLLGMDLRRKVIGTRSQVREADWLHWWPSEADVSIRPGWFYHASEDEQVKSVPHLMEIYYRSVGSNATLLLNIPPDQRGLFHENDVARLGDWRSVLDGTFDEDLAAGGVAAASSENEEHPAGALTDGDPTSWWQASEKDTSAEISVDLGGEKTFDRLLLQEELSVGQRIEAFTLEATRNGNWGEVASGTTVGHKRILRFSSTTADRVRLTVEQSRLEPTLRCLELYKSSRRDVPCDR